MEESKFLLKYGEALDSFWDDIRSKILSWKQSYEWPKGVSLSDSIYRRNVLENRIKEQLDKQQCIDKSLFDAVLKWGFGRGSTLEENIIKAATKEAFFYLKEDRTIEAANSLLKLEGIGISRVSKILALSNQDRFGIYDSRVGDGLKDLKYNGNKIIAIPPGRVVSGEVLSKERFAENFENLTWVLRYFLNKAQEDRVLCEHFQRVADVEIALFSRSRMNNRAPKKYRASQHLQPTAFPDGSDEYWTLAKGKKAKSFWASIDEYGIEVSTGQLGGSKLHLRWNDIDRMLQKFAPLGWFPLGNKIDRVVPGGLGEYFLIQLRRSPKFASHFASVLVSQGKLDFKYGERGAIELKVI